jgi:1,4-alpha-glucan branching enzyme
LSATEKVIPLELRRDFHNAEVDALQGARFMYRMPEGQTFADPASRFQPGGIDRSSQSVDSLKFCRTEPVFPVSAKS